MRQNQHKLKAEMISHSKVIKDKKFLMWVCELSCYPCEIEGVSNYHMIVAHHLQGRNRIGMGLRHDPNSIPICDFHHRQIHEKMGERNFWDKLGVEPIHYANELYEQYKERTNG